MYKLKCNYCKKEFSVLYKSWTFRKFCSRSCSSLYGNRVVGINKKEKHPAWKGSSIQYNSLHKWVQRNYGKPDSCEICGMKGYNVGKIKKTWSISWANKSGNYARIKDDWFGLCKSCHYKFDKGKNKRVFYKNRIALFLE